MDSEHSPAPASTNSTIPTYDFHSPHGRAFSFEVALIENKPVLQNLGQRPRRDTFYVMLLITEGKGLYTIDFEQYPIEAGMLFCIVPGQVHHWELEIQVKGFLVLYTENLLAGQFDSLVVSFPNDFTFFKRETPSGFHVLPAFQRRLDLLIYVLLEEYHDADVTHRELAIQCALGMFIINTQRAYEHVLTEMNHAGNLLFYEFIALVHKHFREIHTVNEYANLIGVTPGHLSTTITETTGHNPLSYIHQRIIMEAKQLLINTDDPASNIATMLSFSDPSYFGRFFKREVGETPTQYRSNFR